MNSRRLIGFVLQAEEIAYHTGGRKRRFASQQNMAAKVRDRSRPEVVAWALMSALADSGRATGIGLGSARIETYAVAAKFAASFNQCRREDLRQNKRLGRYAQ
jgi:hypothetical protein